jgi:hypothetical protein
VLLAPAAPARPAAPLGAPADVWRAVPVGARLAAAGRAPAAEVRAAEVMLNTSLARDATASVPELDSAVPEVAPPPGDAVARASQRRPELRAGRAEVEQAEAEIRVMRSMYAPMAMVRTGPAYTMADGAGWMVMLGLSVPIWRGRLRAGVAEATAMADMAAADLVAMRRMAEGEARGAREDVVAARERRDREQEGQGDAHQVLLRGKFRPGPDRSARAWRLRNATAPRAATAGRTRRPRCKDRRGSRAGWSASGDRAHAP